MVIGGVTLAVALLANVLRREDIKWFKRLRRPQWLTFEAAIPGIWTTIFICGAWSACIIWKKEPGSWGLMALYLLLELMVVAYTPLMLRSRNLRVGTYIGGAGAIWGLIVTLIVWPRSLPAALLLVPYLLWSPVGTYVTWRMEKLNPSQSSAQSSE